MSIITTGFVDLELITYLEISNNCVTIVPLSSFTKKKNINKCTLSSYIYKLRNDMLVTYSWAPS